MNEAEKDHRIRAAMSARDCLANRITPDCFVGDFGSSQDGDVIELVDLIWHQPMRGGLFGANETEWQRYMSEINRLVEVLLQE